MSMALMLFLCKVGSHRTKCVGYFFKSMDPPKISKERDALIRVQTSLSMEFRALNRVNESHFTLRVINGKKSALIRPLVATENGRWESGWNKKSRRQPAAAPVHAATSKASLSFTYQQQLEVYGPETKATGAFTSFHQQDTDGLHSLLPRAASSGQLDAQTTAVSTCCSTAAGKWLDFLNKNQPVALNRVVGPTPLHSDQLNKTLAKCGR